jgi:hypothetical protein
MRMTEGKRSSIPTTAREFMGNGGLRGSGGSRPGLGKLDPPSSPLIQVRILSVNSPSLLDQLVRSILKFFVQTGVIEVHSGQSVVPHSSSGRRQADPLAVLAVLAQAYSEFRPKLRLGEGVWTLRQRFELSTPRTQRPGIRRAPMNRLLYVCGGGSMLPLSGLAGAPKGVRDRLAIRGCHAWDGANDIPTGKVQEDGTRDGGRIPEPNVLDRGVPVLADGGVSD